MLLMQETWFLGNKIITYRGFNIFYLESNESGYDRGDSGAAIIISTKFPKFYKETRWFLSIANSLEKKMS